MKLAITAGMPGSNYITTLRVIGTSNVRPRKLGVFFDRQLTPACVRTSCLEIIISCIPMHTLNFYAQGNQCPLNKKSIPSYRESNALLRRVLSLRSPVTLAFDTVSKHIIMRLRNGLNYPILLRKNLPFKKKIGT